MPRLARCSGNRGMTRRRFLIDVLIVMFGISAWVGVNGIYVQLPLLVLTAPEGWSLPAYIVVIVQAANIGPVLYALSRKFFPNLCKESAWISSLLILGSVAMGTLAFVYETKTSINGTEHSVALLALIFFTALVGCSSSVLFVPYLRNFHEVHLVSFFVGEGLSGLLPSAVALVQGVGGNEECKSPESNSTNDTASSNHEVPHFSPKIYFLFLFSLLVASTCAFWILECSLVSQDKSDPKLSTVFRTPLPHCNQCPSHENLSSGIPKFETRIAEEVTEATSLQSDTTIAYNGVVRSYLYVLIGLICFAGNGFLPGIQSYSCLPYGNVAYHLTVTLAHLSNPIACVLALWMPPPGPRGITKVSTLAVIASTYVTWLAFSSPTPPWRGTTLGTILVVLAWIALTGLVTYAKLSITAIFRRESGATSLFYVGVVTQAGSVAGAIFSFVLTNYSTLLTPYKSCIPSS
ncbi:solute carrier family 52, riboflavin transporter, member 3-A-like [Neodiprion pinetum]|uniref:Riboflavin transporter n=1 Tax=Neodiprion lecontei TaxID=441921 RepID=A0A6J0C272_NEOLC|nr:solute carrier family 52, riboflavin transporter, member 3-A-like [Neodiprion lecontei]XP_046464992.1 solute carrier family 52, riboflavin transporter, member 3-A-like [Neodiprion pinetum]